MKLKHKVFLWLSMGLSLAGCSKPSSGPAPGGPPVQLSPQDSQAIEESYKKIQQHGQQQPSR